MYLFRLRSRIYLLILITLFNFIFGLFLISSVISFVEKTPNEAHTIVDAIQEVKGEPIEAEPLMEDDSEEPIVTTKISLDYYFRIDYTIVQSSCRSMSLLNMSAHHDYIKLFTLEKMLFLIRPNQTFDIHILSLNLILLRTDNKNAANAFSRNSRSLCDYLVELHIGFSFDNSCRLACANEYIRRLTLNSRPFGDPIQPALILDLNYSYDLPIKFTINRMLLYRSTKYFDKSTNIRSLSSSRYVSALILDASGFQSSVIMSEKEQDRFVIKTGLDETSFERDSSSIFVSFLFTTAVNSYLRHENGRIRLSRYQNEYLFKGDATFKLLSSSKNREIIAFESINLPGHLIQVDPETKTAIVLVQPNGRFTGDIEQLDKSFLFQLIFN